MLHNFKLILVAVLWHIAGAAACASDIADMRVDYLREPLGIDNGRPRFSWRMAATEGRFGESQRAWRIVVTDNSGRVS